MMGEKEEWPLDFGAEAAEEGLVALLRLVHHAGVDLRGDEVVGGGDGVDVAGEVEIEVLHGDDLTVPATRRSAL